MGTDMLGKLASAAAPLVPEGAKELYSEALPWGGDKLHSMKEALTKFALSLGVEQHWGHTCTAAAVQAAWRKEDREGYDAACQDLVESGSTTLPGPPPVDVTLSDSDQAIIDRECELHGYSDEKKAEMYMQAALMEYGTDGQWSPASDSLGFFDGASQAGFDKMAGAVGIETTRTDSLNIRYFAAKLRGEDVTRAGVLDDMLQDELEANPGQPVMLTVTSGDSNHGVTVTPGPEGTYYVKDGEGRPMPENVEQPMTAETLEQYVPTDGDDVGARGGGLKVGAGDGGV
jgi:hypothetical protein